MRDALVEKFEGMGMKGEAAKQAATVALGAADEGAFRIGYEGAGHAVAMHSEDAMAGVEEQQEKAARGAQAEEDVAHEQKMAIDRTVDALKTGDPSISKFVAKVAGALGIDLGGDADDDPAAAGGTKKGGGRRKRKRKRKRKRGPADADDVDAADAADDVDAADAADDVDADQAARRKGYKEVGHADALADVDAADAAATRTNKQAEDEETGKDTTQDAADGGVMKVEVVNQPSVTIADEADTMAGDKVGAAQQSLDAGGQGP
jgi:hypothetical protein